MKLMKRAAAAALALGLAASIAVPAYAERTETTLTQDSLGKWIIDLNGDKYAYSGIPLNVDPEGIRFTEDEALDEDEPVKKIDVNVNIHADKVVAYDVAWSTQLITVGQTWNPETLKYELVPFSGYRSDVCMVGFRNRANVDLDVKAQFTKEKQLPENIFTAGWKNADPDTGYITPNGEGWLKVETAANYAYDGEYGQGQRVTRRTYAVDLNDDAVLNFSADKFKDDTTVKVGTIDLYVRETPTT